MSTSLTKLPTDKQSTIIPDGRAAWIALCRWYKGPIARLATVQNARACIRNEKLHQNGNTRQYIKNMVAQFARLANVKEPMTDRAKIDALMERIIDKHYTVLKKMV